jgi:hypothetical protein
MINKPDKIATIEAAEVPIKIPKLHKQVINIAFG